MIRQPAFWRADPPLLIVLVIGEHAGETVGWLAKPFKNSVQHMLIKK
ncbi:hypothetical protein ABT294_21040 [Nonomuraea sp. NPDC000554]